MKPKPHPAAWTTRLMLTKSAFLFKVLMWTTRNVAMYGLVYGQSYPN